MSCGLPTEPLWSTGRSTFWAALNYRDEVTSSALLTLSVNKTKVLIMDSGRPSREHASISIDSIAERRPWVRVSLCVYIDTSRPQTQTTHTLWKGLSSGCIGSVTCGSVEWSVPLHPQAVPQYLHLKLSFWFPTNSFLIITISKHKIFMNKNNAKMFLSNFINK